MDSVLAIVFLSIAPIFAFFFLKTMRDTKKMNGFNLPPGAAGFPFIGEAMQFTTCHPSSTTGKFIQKRVQRYGKIFRTNLLGNYTVISVDPEFNDFVLKSDRKLFEPTLTTSIKMILGTETIELLSNRNFRSATHKFLSRHNVRTRFLEDFEQHTIEVLSSWKEGVVFSAQDQTAKIPFRFMTKNLLSLRSTEETTENLFRLYGLLEKALQSIPLNFPWTTFRQGCKARDTVLEIIRNLVEERSNIRTTDKDNVTDDNPDMLSNLLETPNMTTRQTTFAILGLLMASYSGVSMALCLIVYFLGKCPEAIKQLQEEHARIIYNKRIKGERTLTWEDIQQMNFTDHVVKETLRLGNIILGLPKKVVANVNYKGYDIPSGWSVLLLFSGTHLDPEVYDKPESFNPWRWQDDNKRDKMMESYMPFSRGFHMCKGKEMATMEMAVLIHYLITMYEWELQENDGPVISNGSCTFLNGLPIKVYSTAHKDN